MTDFELGASFGYQLKQSIEALYISHYKFSKLCGISQSNLNKYLSGKTLPGLETLIEIARVSGVNLNWLVTGHGPMKGIYSKPEPPEDLALKRRPFEDLPENGIFCSEFGENLKAIREKKKISATDAATSFFPPIDSESYEAMEAGYLPSSRFLFEELVKFCECTPGELIYNNYFKRGESTPEGLVTSWRNLTRLDDGTYRKTLFDFLNEIPSKEKLNSQDQFEFFIINDDSMSPTFEYGDILMIQKLEPDSTRPWSGLIAFNIDDFVAVRRVKYEKRGFILSCDNSFYSKECLSKEEFETSYYGVVSKAIKSFPIGSKFAGK